MEGTECTGQRPSGLWKSFQSMRPAVHETVSCRKRWHPLITLPCTKQMWMWTWKNVEGKTEWLCESVRKQCEDRNRGANRAVGTNRKCTRPGRRGHLTRGRMGHSQGFWLHSTCRQGNRKVQKGHWCGLDRQTVATEDWGLGQQKCALHVKIQIRKIAFYSVCIWNNYLHSDAK